MQTQRLPGGLVFRGDADQGAFDAVLVHLLEGVLDVVLAASGLGNVLEHVLDGKLEGA